MKILYYSPHPGLNLQSLSGYGTHMREMISAFEKQGCEVLPVIMGGTQEPENSDLNNPKPGLKNAFKRIAGKKIWRTLKDIDLMRFDNRAKMQLDDAVQKFKPDLIYERANYIQLSGVEVAHNRSIPHILEVNAPFVEERNFFSDTRSLVGNKIAYRERQQLLQTGIVVTVSTALKNYFIEKTNIDQNKFLVLPNAINPESISVSSENQKRIRERYDLGGKVVIGFVGSIFEWHGIDKLIRVFSKIDDKETKLLIVGFGEILDDLKELASHSTRSSDIIFTNKVDRCEIFDFIEVMTICVMPNSNWYGSPVKIFEYGAMGKPVLGPSTGPVKEVIDEGKTGILVDSDEESIRLGLKKMLDNDSKSREMGRTFQKKVFEELTWESNAKKVLKKIRSL